MRYDKSRTGYVSSGQEGNALLASESQCAAGGRSTPAVDEISRTACLPIDCVLINRVLIDGQRLEINSSYRKHSILEISNRRYRAVLSRQKPPALACRDLFIAEPSNATNGSRPPRILIANARLGSIPSHTKHSIVEISNRKWMPIFKFPKYLVTGLPSA
jgi:hypothetical protein